ncbi:uncharacterized protein [Acropora muricata]|uniref:uncharacterized protein n=1 Tax=Acropora muricata TaxID=159855 RepID=UPI0034E5D8DF
MSINVCQILYTTFVLGFHTISAPKVEKPIKVFGFGYPTPVLVNASIKTFPLKGDVQYDVQYYTNSTYSCDSQYNRGNVIALDGCHFTQNHTVSKLNSGRSLDCTICNSTANCKSMGIRNGFVLWLIVKAQNHSFISSSCTSFYSNIVVVQPRSFQVTATKRREVTASWEHQGQGTCVVMLNNHNGAMETCTKRYIYDQEKITFNNNVMPWTEYSLTVCCAVQVHQLGENKSSCTCGKPPYVIPSGTVSIRTLPEEPTEAPQLQPCKASCGERLNVTLTWTANDKQVWNGFPVTSTITVRSIAQEKFDFPVINLSVPLPQDYSGSLVSYTIHNLAVEETYRASVKFCSNGGCGPASEATLSCKQCLTNSDTFISAKYAVHSKSPKPSSWPGIALVCGFALVVFIVIISICWCRRNSEQPRENLPTLHERFNDEDMLPEIYDRIYGAASIDDDYHRIEGDDTRLLVPTGHSEEVV